MKFLLNLNKTTKIIIMAVYALVMLLLVTIFFGRFEAKGNLHVYGNNPYDENIYVAVRVNENRTYSKNEDNKITKEKFTWSCYFQVLTLVPDTIDSSVHSIQLYAAIQSTDGTFVYREYSFKDDSSSTGKPSMILSQETSLCSSQETLNATDGTYSFVDKSVEAIYIRVNYVKRVKNANNEMINDNYTLSYKADILRSKEINFEKDFSALSIQYYGNNQTAYSKVLYNGSYQMANAEVYYRSATTSTSKDSYRIAFFLNPYEDYQVSEATTEHPASPTNGYKYLNPETKKIWTYDNGRKSWTDTPCYNGIAYVLPNNDTYILKEGAITKVAYESLYRKSDLAFMEIGVYAKAQNDAQDDKNLISDYIQLGYLNGLIIPTRYDAFKSTELPTSPSSYLSSTVYRATNQIDPLYAVSEIYIVAKVILKNGTIIKSQGKLDLQQVPKY